MFGIAVPPFCMNLLQPILSMPRVHMIRPFELISKVLRWLFTVFRNADIRLKVLVNVSPRASSVVSN